MEPDIPIDDGKRHHLHVLVGESIRLDAVERVCKGVVAHGQGGEQRRDFWHLEGHIVDYVPDSMIDSFR